MDAFVIKTPRVNGQKCSQDTANLSLLSSKKHSGTTNVGALNKIKPSPGQRTFSDLKGVVSLERIEKAVQKLQNDNVSANEKTAILEKLSAKLPATDIIRSSGIGKLVRKISKGSNPKMDGEEKKLVKTAEKLYQVWKHAIQNRVEVEHNAKNIEVDYDAPTKKIRENAVSLILQAANAEGAKHHVGTNYCNANAKDVVHNVEKYIFEMHNRLTNTSYRRSIRKIVFDIRYNKGDIKSKLSLSKEKRPPNIQNEQNSKVVAKKLEDVLEKYTYTQQKT
jgi:hypothetical protein